MPSHAAQLAEASRLHAAGELPQAEAMYRRLLADSPHDADVCHLLGALERQLGRTQSAVDRLRQAIALREGDATVYFNLAGALEDLGHAAEAENTYRAALRLNPSFAEAHLNLGTLARRAGRHSEAIACYGRAIEARAEYTPAHFALGLAQQHLGAWRAAADAYRRTLELSPEHRQARLNLATVLHCLGESEAAIAEYKACLAAAPNHSQLHHNLAHVLAELGESAEAECHYRRAIELQPNDADARLHLAMLYYRHRRYESAAEQCRQALALRPDWPAAYVYLGLSESHLSGPAAAERPMDIAARLEPENLLRQVAAISLGQTVFHDRTEIDTYRRRLSARLAELPNTRATLRLADIPGSFCKPPFCLAYHGGDDRALKEQFASIFARHITPATIVGGRRLGPPHVGLVVTAGHEGVFLRGMSGILRRLHPGQLRVTIVCHVSARRRFTTELAAAPVDYLYLPGDFAQAVRAVAEASFDLLHYWEIGTDSINYFLPFFRCAPIQVTSWGWPVTSGNAAVDYFLSSELLEDPSSDHHYSERLVRLSTLPTCYARPTATTTAPTRAAFSLADDVRIYLCPQNLAKFHPDLDPLIGGILRSDVRGRLVAIAAREQHVTDMLRRRMTRTIPDVANRITFLPRMSSELFQQLLRVADVVLDTPHYGGGANTTADVLGQGLPLVTLRGEFHRGRWAAACYHRMGMPYAVPAGPDDYVKFAVRLANDPRWRSEWSQEIADRNHVLFADELAVQETAGFWCRAATEARDRLL